MDPLADKLLIVAALISLVSLHRLAAWIAMVIITRELGVTVLRLAATQAGVVMASSAFGKLKTCLQIASILTLAVRFLSHRVMCRAWLTATSCQPSSTTASAWTQAGSSLSRPRI